tara:strand:- start:92 stop:352 length:261 start_codon:yes stop_codon:yes gene_type:complete
MLKITKSDGQYILNNEGQITVFDTAVLSGSLLILFRVVSIFNPSDPFFDLTTNVGLSTVTTGVKEAVSQLEELGMVITDEAEKVGV